MQLLLSSCIRATAAVVDGRDSRSRSTIFYVWENIRLCYIRRCGERTDKMNMLDLEMPELFGSLEWCKIFWRHIFAQWRSLLSLVVLAWHSRLLLQSTESKWRSCALLEMFLQIIVCGVGFVLVLTRMHQHVFRCLDKLFQALLSTDLQKDYFHCCCFVAG